MKLQEEDGVQSPQTVRLVFDVAELAIRMLEGVKGVKRPAGVSPQEILQEMSQESRFFWVEIARHAVAYMIETIKGDGRPN